VKVLTLIVAVLALNACSADYNPTPLSPSTVSPAPPQPPVPGPVVPLTVTLSVGRSDPEVGQAISFVASSGAPITSATWHFGNGGEQLTARGETAYAYQTAGTFVVQVTVTTADGRTATDQASVTVARHQSPPPEPTPTPTPPNTSGFQTAIRCTPKPAGTATHCQATVTYNGVTQPSGTVTDVAWDFGDGGADRQPTPVTSHVYAGPGTYTVFADVVAANPGVPNPHHQVASTTVTIP